MPEEKVVLKNEEYGQSAGKYERMANLLVLMCCAQNARIFRWSMFAYMVARFGMISWLPIYLLTVKHFSKEQMSVAFLSFGVGRAIPLHALLAGWPSDKLLGVAECRASQHFAWFTFCPPDDTGK